MIENSSVYVKVTMVIELRASMDAMAKLPRPPSFVRVSPSVEILGL